MRRLRLKISSIALAGTIVLSLAGMAESGAAQAKAIVQQVAAGQLLAQEDPEHCAVRAGRARARPVGVEDAD